MTEFQVCNLVEEPLDYIQSIYRCIVFYYTYQDVIDRGGTSIVHLAFKL